MSEREYWANLAKRQGMYLERISLVAVQAYVDGYDAHARRHGGPGLDGWREWLVLRRGSDCNHVWWGLVRHIALPHGWDHRRLTPGQEERVIKVLFALLDEFLAERESARGVF
ncbi:hypothetical protein ABCR94_15855 [Streptomyces sp. 21So2-11]|uniref:hypothetical protein n=1 Tax=Streptomyces sp. 21So2-11 TaxID=3144408 RepID=UPI00321B5611